MKIRLERIRQLERGELSTLLRKRIWKIWAKRYSEADNTGFHAYRSIGSLGEKPFYLHAGERKGLQALFESQFQEHKKSLIDCSEKVCQRNFMLLGINMTFKEKVNWHFEPLSQKEWPKSFYADIPYTGENRIGDIKYPWELNRHQYLVTLGQAYYLTQDKKYVREIISIISSWIEDNPPFLGVNWISALEVGIRAISWIWALNFIKDSKEIEEKFIEKTLGTLMIHARYLENNLSIGRYANNHLIGEASALVMLGLYLDGLNVSRRWVKKGLAILDREIVKQIYPDGGGLEQASSYLRFIVEFYLLVFLLIRKHNIKWRSSTMDRLEKAFEHMMLTITPEGESPKFGDSDDARAIFLNRNGYWDSRGMLALGAVLFNRGDFKYVSGQPSPELLWFSGIDGYNAYCRLEAFAPKMTSCFIKNTGYGIFRDSWEVESNYHIFDCGPLGYGPGAHGHADALSLQAYLKGKPLIVDPGTFAYNQSPSFRKYFRGTSAHNTVAVEGKDQSESGGRMAWKTKSEVRVNKAILNSIFDFIDADHNGYHRLEGPVTHRRGVFYAKRKYTFVHDTLIGEGSYSLELNFHFPPELLVEQMGDGMVRAKAGNKAIGALQIANSKGMKFILNHGSKNPIRGWYSIGYGKISPAYTLTVKTSAELPFETASLIFSPSKAPGTDYRVKHVCPGVFFISGSKSTDLLIMQNFIECEPCRIQFDGNLLYLSVDADTNITHFFLGGAKGLDWGKHRLFESKKAEESLEIFRFGKLMHYENRGVDFYLNPNVSTYLKEIITAMRHCWFWTGADSFKYLRSKR